MNHRMVLGRHADARETAELTLADPNSVSYIADAQVHLIVRGRRALHDRVRSQSVFCPSEGRGGLGGVD